ncbi:selenocysteine-specific translation elongation factor [Ferdinandcohnia sp. Marseille-Q9671]
MVDAFYTIGMAGHIDHGKTTLTKALTGVDTDRLKEEKERQISIEPGYAPLQLEGGTHVSIVDVPGHERFIRQMIAGVAGIDLVLLVIAADEGVMPQTKEHLQILTFLGIKKCLVVLTKISKVEEELLELASEEIKDILSETNFKDAPIFSVDSVTEKGIPELKQAIQKEVAQLEQKERRGSFRLPIDQAFTVQGHGTVVRGTVFEGEVTTDTPLTLLPAGKKIKVRQIQVHNQETTKAIAGQRAAINITGAIKEEIQRGDVLVDSDTYQVTRTIDIALKLVPSLSIPLKQRAPVTFHVGTSETFGRIVFFDRNDVQDSSEELLCQVRLDNEIVVRRGDRFILRRPTPVETLGGGWIIQPQAGKYRFGEETITKLKKQMESSPDEIIHDLFRTHKLLSKEQLLKLSSLQEDELTPILTTGIEAGEYIEINKNSYSSLYSVLDLQQTIVDKLEEYHNEYSLRIGMSKAELLQVLGKQSPKDLIEYSLADLILHKKIKKENQYVSMATFQPKVTNKAMKAVIHDLENDGIQPKKWEDYIKDASISTHDANELRTHLIKSSQAMVVNNEILIHKHAFDKAVQQLKNQTSDHFSITEAKEILSLSRKYLIPFLELLDERKITSRADGNRVWINKEQKS